MKPRRLQSETISSIVTSGAAVWVGSSLTDRER
jgi:hypothetical protein